MPTVSVNGVCYDATVGERLSAFLIRYGLRIDLPCGGHGRCGKCKVHVNGKEELACRYVIHGDIEVTLTLPASIVAATGDGDMQSNEKKSLSSVMTDGSQTLALDIGTTTLALAQVLTDGEMGEVVTANNPQRIFGADIMSRIAYAREHGHEQLTAVLHAELAHMLSALARRLSPAEETSVRFDSLYVTGNATMLHLFCNVDPSSMGVAPYTPVFLDEKHLSGEECGLPSIRTVVVLPSFSSFVGGDLVSGLYEVKARKDNTDGMQDEHARYSLLIDLGTNAEILLYSDERILCTAAAAGPCFEGASISCGMSAVDGAICSYEAGGRYHTIGDVPARGVCGSGLVDAIAVLLDEEVIDETGFMEDGDYTLADTVTLTQADVREFQLAKSAVCAAILTLLNIEGISEQEIAHLYIAGGFAMKLNIKNAVRTGLFPPALENRCIPVGNSALHGTIRYAVEHGDLTALTSRARYVDLAADAYFSSAFMEGMLFA